jgi:hypothetical protein
MFASPTPKRGPGIDAAVEAIAQRHLNIETLQVRSNDRLDFYDVPVWSMREALTAAYLAGAAAAARRMRQPVQYQD